MKAVRSGSTSLLPELALAAEGIVVEWQPGSLPQTIHIRGDPGLLLHRKLRDDMVR
jgi:hypothetical protein